MKKTIALILALTFTITLSSQSFSIAKAPNLVEQKELSPKFSIPMITIPLTAFLNLAKPKHDTISFRSNTTFKYPDFYPDQLVYVNPTENYTQRWFSPKEIKYLQIKDVKLKVATKTVKRVINGQIVKERRWIGLYSVEIVYNNGNTIYIPKTSIITNIDLHKDYPAIIPAGRYLIYNAFDDANSIFNPHGHKYSKDKGLEIDYDDYSN